MAIKTGEIFNSLVFGGVNSADYGIYITGEGVFNAPKRSVNMVAVPGRNGSIAIDQGHWENIEVTYPAGTFGMDEQEFRTALSDFRNAIASQVGYQRLTDTYHPDEYRMAIYMDGLEVEPTTYNKAGKFELKFNCKPQRWLTSGEIPVTIGEWGATKEASGEIVTIESEGGEAAKSLVVTLEPIQDLNGYDKPWSGGAGKNKLVYPYQQGTNTINGVTFTVNNDGSVKINGTCTATGTYLWLYGSSVKPLMPTLEQGKTYTLSIDGAVGGINSQCIFYGSSSVVNTAYGSGDKYVTFTVPDMSGYNGNGIVIAVINGYTFNNVTVKPMIRLASDTDATWQPYENICPISGRTEVVTQRTGVNVWDEEWEQGALSTADGSNLARTTRVRSANYISVVPNETYYFKIGATGISNGLVVCFYDRNKTFISGAWQQSESITIPNNAHYIRFSTGDAYGGTYNHDISINYPSTDHDYHAYDGTSYTTDLGRTVYGGTLDVVSGVLTVDRVAVDLESLSWTLRSTGTSHKGWSSNLPSPYITNSASTPILEWIASDYAYEGGTTGSAIATNGADSYSVGIYHYLATSGTTQTAFYAITDVNSTPSGQLCYELATPQTYQLTPQQIELLLGENHVWSDGAITMQYGDDPNSLWNPTQYDAGPLLAIEGNGNISFNGYTVVVDAGEYGLINVKGTKILSDPITYSTKTELYNSGDTIEIYLELHWELKSARSPRATRVSNLQNTGDGQTETQPFSNGSLKGTTIIDTFFLSSQDTTRTNVFSCDVEFSNGHTATTTLTLEVFWDSANSTLSFHTTPTGHGRWGRVIRTYPTSIIEAVSSKTYLGDPTYVDCEIGEAYKIEDGEIVSLNKYIELGSDLPKLSSGANDVTISDTVTELKVTPNWWKL